MALEFVILLFSFSLSSWCCSLHSHICIFSLRHSHSQSVDLTRRTFFYLAIFNSTYHSFFFLFFLFDFVGTSFIRWNLQIDSVMPMRLPLLPDWRAIFDCNLCSTPSSSYTHSNRYPLSRHSAFPFEIPIPTKLSPFLPSIFVWRTFFRHAKTQSNYKMNFIRYNQSKYLLKEVTTEEEV